MDIEEVWFRLIQQLKTYPHVNASQIDAFFSRIQIQAVSSDFIMFTASNAFIKDWIETHFIKDIHQALFDIYGANYTIQFEIDTTLQTNEVPAVPVTSSSNNSSHAYHVPHSAPTPHEIGNAAQQEDRAHDINGSPSQPQGSQTQVYNTTERISGVITPRNNSAQTQSAGQENKDSLTSPPQMSYKPVLNINTQQPAQRTPLEASTLSPLEQYQRELTQARSNDSYKKQPIDGVQKTNAENNTAVQRTIEDDNPFHESHGSPSLTFDTFVIGDSNRLAYSMAEEVAGRPGDTDLNPLFIYGRSGVGKTHLLCAIQNYIHEQYPEFNVCYIDSMELVNRYSEAAIAKSVDKHSFKNFESYFDNTDVLLIDDIQGLQGKPGTLDVVFRIFNKMINKGKQMVFAADRAPKNIDLDERYSTRFNQGATIDIQPPDNETKRSIVKSFVHQCQEEEDFEIDFSDEIIDYIVEHSSSNIREVKSAITTTIFAMKVNNGNPLSIHEVKELLNNHFLNENTTKITIEAIQAAVEDFYGVSHADLVGKKRTKEIKHPRQVAIYLIRELLDGTYKSIGEAFNRDHTTIMHSYDLIANGIKEDRNLREELEAIREKLRIQQY